MPTSAFFKYQQFVEDFGNKIHDVVGTNDTLRILLSNTAPNVATHQVKADATEITAGSGYSAGGPDTQNDGTETGGVLTVTGVDIVITASGGSIGPFRYAILYNDSVATPMVKPLIGYWDYGAPITLADTETLTIDFGASMFTVT